MIWVSVSTEDFLIKIYFYQTNALSAVVQSNSYGSFTLLQGTRTGYRMGAIENKGFLSLCGVYST